MREGGGGGAHAAHRGGLGAGEARAQQATVCLLSGGRDAAEPVGLEGGGGDRGGGGLARDGVEELERLAAEAAAELVGDDDDGVVLGLGDVVPARVLLLLDLVGGEPRQDRGGLEDLLARGRDGADVDVEVRAVAGLCLV